MNCRALDCLAEKSKRLWIPCETDEPAQAMGANCRAKTQVEGDLVRAPEDAVLFI